MNLVRTSSQLLLVTALCTVLAETASENVQVMMSIFPSGTVVKYVNEDLNLTCRVHSNAALRYRVTWSLPIKTKSGDKSRVSIYRQPNEVTITVYQLQEADSGQYFCEVTGNDIHYRQNLWLVVKSSKPEKQKCSDRMFQCSSGPCIPRRYACDGVVDCPDGRDESTTTCGTEDPCKGKIKCDDGRCISSELCCDLSTDPNCVSLYLVPCCHKLTLLTADASSHPQYSDISFIQSTIYTIVSCAVAFIFITLIMIVAICRIHMKRSVMSLHPRGTTPQRRRWPWNCLQRPGRHHHRTRVVARWSSAADEMASDESLYQSGRTYPCSVSSNGSFVVTYNGADGVRLVERLPKPPPYTEVPEAAPRPPVAAAGPPPPYCSVEDLCNPRQYSNPSTECPAYQSPPIS